MAVVVYDVTSESCIASAQLDVTHSTGAALGMPQLNIHEANGFVHKRMATLQTGSRF